MIALDTNVLVRFLMRDDEKQARAVYTRLKRAEAERENLFIPLSVVLETIWVLESAYGQSRREILNALDHLTEMPIFEFEKIDVLQSFAGEARKSGTDLSDLLLALTAQSCGCTAMLTFDKKAAKNPLFQLLPPEL